MLLVRWNGALRKGETTTLRVPVRVVKTAWDVLRLYVSVPAADGARGFATHKELILVLADVVSVARERVLDAAPRKQRRRSGSHDRASPFRGPRRLDRPGRWWRRTRVARMAA